MATFSDPFVTDFLLEKELNEGRRIATLRTYHMAFRILADNPYVDMSDFSTYTELNFKRLLQQCLAERKWSSETYNRMMKNWRMYCRWLSDSGILPENPLSRMKQRAVPRKLPKALDREQVRSMLYALNRIFPASGDYVSERNRTMVYVYLYTGLRLYELVNLRVGDFDPSGEFLRVNDGK